MNICVSGCLNIDDYTEVFQAQLNAAIALSSFRINLCRREKLPRHIVQLIHSKQRYWKNCQKTGNKFLFNTTSKIVRAAFRQHRRNKENNIKYDRSRKLFFFYVNKKIGNLHREIVLMEDDKVLSN